MLPLVLQSPAKLNLRLDVLGKRSDGYHDLRMLMVCINLNDEIEMHPKEKGIRITCDNPDVPQDEGNIVYKAIKEIMAYSSRNLGLDIHIKKKIPVASGMGGGSSNAATVIRGINELLKLKLPREKLMAIGAKLGADVPFFLFESPAIATGIGDRLTPVKKIPKMSLMVVNPGIAVSTEWVYRNFKPNRNHLKQNGRSSQEVDLPEAFSNKRDIVKILNNDLESVTTEKFPVISKIKNLLLDAGATASQMTGSGPSVFGIFPDRNALEKGLSKIKDQAEKNWKIFKTENF